MMNQQPGNQQPWQQQPQQGGYQQPSYQQYNNQGGSGKNKTMTLLGIGAIGCIGLIILGVIFVFGGLAFLVASTPPTHIIPGREVSKEYRDTMNSLGMLNNSEKIIYMYADGLTLEEGMYVMTDQHIIMYVETWEPPLEKIQLDSVDRVEVSYSTTLFDDSMIYITTDLGTEDEYEIWFPLSNENGTDRKFVDDLVTRTGAEKNILSNGNY